MGDGERLGDGVGEVQADAESAGADAAALRRRSWRHGRRRRVGRGCRRRGSGARGSSPAPPRPKVRATTSPVDWLPEEPERAKSSSSGMAPTRAAGSSPRRCSSRSSWGGPPGRASPWPLRCGLRSDAAVTLRWAAVARGCAVRASWRRSAARRCLRGPEGCGGRAVRGAGLRPCPPTPRRRCAAVPGRDVELIDLRRLYQGDGDTTRGRLLGLPRVVPRQCGRAAATASGPPGTPGRAPSPVPGSG